MSLAVVQPVVGELQLVRDLLVELLALGLVLLVRFREYRLHVFAGVEGRGSLGFGLDDDLLVFQFRLLHALLAELVVGLLAELLVLLLLLLLLVDAGLARAVLEGDDRAHRRVVLVDVDLGAGRAGDGRRARGVRGEGDAALDGARGALLLGWTQVRRHLQGDGVLRLLQWR